MSLRGVRDSWIDVARSEPFGSDLIVYALVAYTIATVAFVFTTRITTPRERAFLLVVALLSWITLVVCGWARGRLPRIGVTVAIAVTLGASVLAPWNQSHDVFSYAMYGRMVTVYHENPFSRYPVHFEQDPMRQQVGNMWQRTPDIYGPAFTGLAAALVPVVGESQFRVRFAYQLLSALAVAAILVLLWRRTRSVLPLAFVGLHPLTSISVVNGGHADALVALGVLLGALLAMERKAVLAAFALAFAVAINFTTISAAVAIGVWAWRRKWSRRELFRFGSITLVVGALPYLFLGGWMKNAHQHSELISRQSFWNAVVAIVDITKHVPNASTLLVGLLMLTVVVRQTRVSTPELPAAAAIVVFVVASPWVMPWYAFAALPLLALRKPTLLTWVIALDATFILIGDQFPALGPDGIGAFWHNVLQIWVPLLALVACAIAVLRRPQESELTAQPALPALV
jgi:hypothetical protein